MEKYKRIIREIKKVFPEATDIRLVVFTSTGERSLFSADIKGLMDAEDVCQEMENNDIKEMSLTLNGSDLTFSGKIFVTNETNSIPSMLGKTKEDTKVDRSDT